MWKRRSLGQGACQGVQGGQFDEDAAVPYDQWPLRCEKLKAAGNRCEVYTVEGAPHGVGPWEKKPEWQGYKQKMVAWLKESLR